MKNEGGNVENEENNEKGRKRGGTVMAGGDNRKLRPLNILLCRIFLKKYFTITNHQTRPIEKTGACGFE
jgi:hypothetical protein